MKIGFNTNIYSRTNFSGQKRKIEGSKNTKSTQKNQKLTPLGMFLMSFLLSTSCMVNKNTTNNNQSIVSDANKITIPKEEIKVELQVPKKSTLKLEDFIKYKNTDVLIDAGHDRKHIGTYAIWEGDTIKEHEITRKLAKKVEKKLLKRDYNTDILLDHWEEATPQERRRLKDSLEPKSFISIHANWFHSGKAKGFESFYNSKTDKELAKCITESYRKAGYDLRKYPVQYGKRAVTLDHNEFNSLPDDGVNVPSTLIEIGFMSNEDDLAKMVTDEGLNEHAEIITNGIIAYLEKKGIYPEKSR